MCPLCPWAARRLEVSSLRGLRLHLFTAHDGHDIRRWKAGAEHGGDWSAIRLVAAAAAFWCATYCSYGGADVLGAGMLFRGQQRADDGEPLRRDGQAAFMAALHELIQAASRIADPPLCV